MIRKLRIENFKTIARFEVTLDRINVLVGANNSGKSSLLHALHFAVAIAQSRPLLPEQLDDFSGKKVSFSMDPSQVLYTPLHSILHLAHVNGNTTGPSPHIAVQLVTAAGKRGSIGVRVAPNGRLRATLIGRSVIRELQDLNHPFSVYVPGLAGLARTETELPLGVLRRIVARGDANLALRNVLRRLRDLPDRWSQFLDSVRQVFPGTEISVRFNPDTTEHIEVTVSRGGPMLPLDGQGTGFLQTLQILSYIYLFRPRVTLLDEPDSHLHPNNQRALGALLERLAEEGETQLLLATHSRHLLDVFRRRESRIWVRGGCRAEATEDLDLLLDLGALDGAESLMARKLDLVVLTEDGDTRYMRLVLNSMIEETRYGLFSYEGSSKLDTAKLLARFISKVSPSTAIIIHRDADYMFEDEMHRICQRFEQHQLRVFLTPGIDIEAVFLRPDHLRALNPGAEEAIARAREETLTGCEERLREKARHGVKERRKSRYDMGLSTMGDAEIDQWVTRLDPREERWLHTKTVLGALRDAFKRATGRTLIVERTTEHLRVPAFLQMLKDLHVPVHT